MTPTQSAPAVPANQPKAKRDSRRGQLTKAVHRTRSKTELTPPLHGSTTYIGDEELLVSCESAGKSISRAICDSKGMDNPLLEDARNHINDGISADGMQAADKGRQTPSM